MLKKNILLITALIVPNIIFADGQDSFTIIFGFIDFLKVFVPWIIIISFGIILYKRIMGRPLKKKKKVIIYISTGIIALFIWSMIIHDSEPFEGPIDSIFYLPNGESRF